MNINRAQKHFAAKMIISMARRTSHHHPWMLALALFLVATAPMAGQNSAVATVMFKPLDSPALLGIVGPAKGQVSGWSVEIRAGSQAVTLARETIMSLAPSIHELPSGLAQDALTRISTSSWKSRLAAALTDLSASGGLATTAVGLLKNNKMAEYSGVAATGIAFALKSLRSGAPNPGPYIPELLPSSVSIAANGGQTWYVVAQPVSGAITIGPLPVFGGLQ